MQRSDLYIFASNNKPGFSLSRSFTAAMPGVLGADLAASDLSHFLSRQRATPTSVSLIFTRSGEIVAFPDEARVAALVPRNGEMMAPLPKLTELNEPAAAGLFAAACLGHARVGCQGARIRPKPFWAPSSAHPLS